MSNHYGDTTRIQACLDRLRNGDPAAKNDLLEESWRRLRQLASRMLNKDFPAVRRRGDGCRA